MQTLDNIQNQLATFTKRLAVYQDLAETFADFLQTLPLRPILPKAIVTPIIWSCWLQGLDDAPEIVQVCHEERLRCHPNYLHQLVTAKNLADYLTLDDYLLDKWHKGLIKEHSLANIIRLELLHKYGGIWMDATVLCTTDSLPGYMLYNPLFVYSSWSWCSCDVRPVSVWLISSIAKHPLLKAISLCLQEYWRRFDHLVDYFIFHMFWRMLIERWPHLWAQVPRISNFRHRWSQSVRLGHRNG